MFRATLIAGLVALFTVPAMAAEPNTFGLGVDFEMPYSLRVNGASARARGNLNVGVDGRYWATESMNYGMRFAFDIEDKGGTRQISLAPGLQYHWMPTEAFNPFVRFDVPVLLKNQRDIGISAGAGIAWQLGEAIGVENMAIRYDFDFNYYFGLGNAVDVLSLNIFKIGFDYRF